jgi:hypothetical protein
MIEGSVTVLSLCSDSFVPCRMSTPAGRAKLEQNLDWLLAPVPKRAKKVEKKVGPKAGSKRSTSAKGFGRPKDK